MLNDLIQLAVKQYKGNISVVCRDVEHCRESLRRLEELAKQSGCSWLACAFWDRRGYVNWLRVDFILAGEAKYNDGLMIWDCPLAWPASLTQHYEATTWAGDLAAGWQATFGILSDNTFRHGSAKLSPLSS